MTSRAENEATSPLFNSLGRARLTLLGALVCSLVVCGFILLLQTPVQAFVSKGTSCSASSCHGASEATATISVALNGNQGTSITVTPGSTFEVDWIYTNLRNTSKYDGTQPEIAIPTGWTIARGTANSPALTNWNSVWDLTGGVTTGWNTTYSTAGEFPNSPVGYSIDYNGTVWDSGTRNAAADNATAADRDGVANRMGVDARITVPAGASPGAYTVMVLGIGHNSADTKAHVEQAITVTVSSGISQTITVGTPAPASATYSSQFTVAATASSGLPVTYSSGSTGICTNSGATFTMISGTGTCIVQYDQAGGSGYAPAARVTNNVTATKATQATVTVSAPASAVYAQAGLSVTAAGGSGSGAYSYSHGASTACTVNSTSGALTITSGTGTCSITATRAADTNYNVSAASAPATVTINKATQATVTVSAPASAVYAQAGLSATASGGSGSGAYSYSHGTSTACTVNSTSGALTITSGTGTCSITATRAADTNYNVSAASSAATVTISKASSSVTAWPTASDITYGQTLVSSILAGGTSAPNGTFAFTSPATVPNAGTAAQGVTFTPTDSANYTNVIGSVNVTVNKADQATVTVSAPASAVYAQAGLSATAAGGSGSGAYSYSHGASTACTVNSTSGALTITSGTGTCSITATRAADTNYNVSAASAPATVTINKATQTTLTVTGPASVTYGSTGSITTTGGSGTGALSYSHGASTGCTVNNSTGLITVTDASGSCSVTATKAADNNYDQATSAGYTVTLNKATQTTVTVTAPASATFGQAGLSATASGGSGSGAYSYSHGGSTACTVNSTSGALTITSATGTCSISATREADSNYNISAASAPATVTVNKADPTVSAWPTASSIIYGQTLESSILTGGTVSTLGSFAFTTPLTAPNAGTAAQSVTFTPTDSANYNTVVGSVNVTVNLADQTIGAITFTTAPLAVSGTTTVSATATSGLTVNFSSDTETICTVSGSTVSGVSAGTCIIRAIQAGNSNYLPAADVTQTLEVTGGTTNVTLTVALAGTGSGTVNSDPSGEIVCGSNCTELYTSGTNVKLTATTSGSSVFAGWSGACTGTGDCLFTITADTTVTATFNQPPMVMLGLVPYATIQAAYAAAPAETTVKIRDQIFTEDLLFDGAVNLNFLGGYNETWAEPATGNTTIHGSVTVSGASGGVTISNIVIE